MSEFIPCPGCRAPLHVSRDVCDACRRPLGDSEREAWREDKLRRADARRVLPRRIAFWLILGAGVVWAYRPVIDLLQMARSDMKRQMDAAASPDMAGKPLSPMAQRFAGVFLPRGKEVAAPVDTLPVAPAPPPPPPPKPVVARPPEPPMPVYPRDQAKRAYGVVYDIHTAVPVPGARLSFSGSNNAKYQVATDELGRYHLDLLGVCANAEYNVEVTAPGYREGQIEDTDPPYFEKTAAQRKFALEQLAPSDLAPFPLRCKPSDEFVALDIVLVPK